MRRLSYSSQAALLADPGRRISRLAGHVEPIAGETLMSLLSRSAVANGFVGVQHILQDTGAVGPSHVGYTPFVKFDHAAAIAQRLALPSSDIEALMHGPVNVDGWGAAVNWFGTVLPRHLLDATSRRVSPRALRISQHHRAEWMIRPLTFCPETMENLIDKCGECGHRLSWWTTCGLWRCEKCGKSLRRALPGKVPYEYRSALKIVCGLVSPNPETRTDALSAFPAPFSRWEAGEVFTAIVELGVLASKPQQNVQRQILGGMARGDFTSYALEHLVIGCRFIREWPKSLHASIQSLGAGESKLSMYNLAGPFQNYLKTQARPTRLTTVMAPEIRNVLSDFDLNIERLSGVRPRWGKTTGILTQNEAVRKFGIDAVTFQRLLNGGHCVRSAREEEFCYVDGEALGKSIAIWRTAMDAYRASQSLGVPRHSVEALRSRGFLKLIDDHDARLLAGESIYCPESVRALESRIRSVPVVDGEAKSSLGGLLRGHFHPDTWVDAVAAILNGELLVVADVPAKDPILALMVDEEQVVAWLNRIPPRATPSGVAISNIEAARILQIPYPYLMRAASAGLLKVGRRSGQKAGSLLIALDDLATFHENYVIQAEGEDRAGLKRCNFGRLMKKAGYQPAAKVGPTTIWYRSDTMALLKSQQFAEYRQYKLTRTGGRPRRWETFAATSSTVLSNQSSSLLGASLLHE